MKPETKQEAVASRQHVLFALALMTVAIAVRPAHAQRTQPDASGNIT